MPKVSFFFRNGIKTVIGKTIYIVNGIMICVGAVSMIYVCALGLASESDVNHKVNQYLINFDRESSLSGKYAILEGMVGYIGQLSKEERNGISLKIIEKMFNRFKGTDENLKFLFAISFGYIGNHASMTLSDLRISLIKAEEKDRPNKFGFEPDMPFSPSYKHAIESILADQRNTKPD